MNFTEQAFLPFLAIVYVLWLVCRRNYRVSVGLLLAASLVFYGYHQWELLLLILGYCVGNWVFGLWLARSGNSRCVLAGGVGLNLTVLAFWKYMPLLVRTVLNFALWLDLQIDIEPPHWILPWGISFYTFTCIAYLVDVYRIDVVAERSLACFSLFICFFPHQMAGPILRSRDLLDKLQPGALPERAEAPLEALLLLARGAFKKLVLADRIAMAIDPFFTHVSDGSTAGVWALPYVCFYAFQIYFDFSGYTDMARGLALLFGFRWPENFNLPYLATSIQDFWQRWHMTLSRFLRDYLYIPLGGSRGSGLVTYRNLMITMLLGGLWHGASWAFLLWGGLHGIFLAGHRLWSRTELAARLRLLTGPRRWLFHLLAVLVTFHLVCLAWCFFRLTDIGASLACVQKWVFFDTDKILVGGVADASLWFILVVYAAFAFLTHAFWPFLQKALAGEAPRLYPARTGFAWGVGLALILLAGVLSPGDKAPAFIYFQF